MTKFKDIPDPKRAPKTGFKERTKTVPPPIPQVQPPEPPLDLELLAAWPGKPEEGEQTVSSYKLKELRRLLVEQALRKTEGLALYEPLYAQERFHRCWTRQRLLRGSNRGGKTLPAAVEVARAVTGKDPWRKYPQEGGRAFCVGKDLDHVGQVMWRKLARPGAFKILRDKVTGAWRAYRPWDPEDKLREPEAKPAPALIPKRMIKTIAWENKAKGIPKVVILTNGWELNFYSSQGKPPQGSDIDIWWFDEEITDEEWHPEMVARVLDRKGRGIWSATPQAGTDKLFELHEKAQDELGSDNPSVSEFVILLADNPHIGEQEKKDFAASLSEDDREVRIGGEFVLATRRVFPEFSMATHGVEFFQIPPEWTRYMVVDPGRQVCAVLFAAVPPPSTDLGDRVVVYDELYIENCSAEIFGQKVAQRASGQQFECFIIDHHGGRLTDIGAGLSVERQYSKALQKHKIKSVKTGHEFHWGCDDVDGGVEAVRSWLRIREDGTTKLLILKEKLPNLEKEFKRYRYKVVRGQITDKPEDRGKVHHMANLRYLSLYGPRFVRPQGERKTGGAIGAFRDKQKRQQQRQGSGSVNLGPGRGLGATRR